MEVEFGEREKKIVEFSKIGPPGSHFVTQYPSGIAEPSETCCFLRDRDFANMSSFSPLTIFDEINGL